ncbi:hypothetical protein [Magnetospirillum moscoviense]|uniref:Formylmethanofuran dehydrogenase subunit E domain-containing protein n=1 Tax=Magnetospirillum moscoviense TaxID=1437059 RepID=A0A178M6R8_9PROT|nr:hypothetical protein [Magnetospirillum moscoviense]OAN43735.1 hypothetical protein A6A05_05160 [Magnetospirillum moscoviense]
MKLPDFFDQAPRITVYDPLAAFVGAPADGCFTYGYGDAVRLAGHSCPTVAGAWLMTRAALVALWPGQIPKRGAIQVLLPEAQHEGVAGVIAAVAGLVTGAAGPGGFKGIAGRFSRLDLLAFDTPVPATLGFRRTDSGAGVAARYRPELVPADPMMRGHLQALLSGDGDDRSGAAFAELWQDRVRRILLDHADDPELIALAPF